MKSKLAIIACLFGLLVLACDDKGTDPPPVVTYKTAVIKAHVTDATGSPLSNIWVFAGRYYYRVDSLWEWGGTLTDITGRCTYSVKLSLNPGKDTIWIWAQYPGSGPYGDTSVFRIENTIDTIDWEYQFNN